MNEPAGQTLPFPAHAEVERDPRSGTVLRVSGAGLIREQREGMPGLARARQRGDHEEIAVAFIAAHAGEFKLREPARELEARMVFPDELGHTHVRLSQYFEGLPVLDSEIIVHLDENKHVYLVEGGYAPSLVGVDAKPEIPEDEALAIALRAMGAPVEPGQSKSRLAFFIRDGVDPVLVHEVSAAPSLVSGWRMLVNAHSGEVERETSTVMDIAPSGGGIEPPDFTTTD